jgi:hypothetical protein
MRAMLTIAILGMALACSADAGWSETATFKTEAKSLAAKAEVINSLRLSPGIGSAQLAAMIKESGVNQIFKNSGQEGGTSTETTPDAPRQSFVASGLANSGFGASLSALKADEFKEPSLVNELR